MCKRRREVIYENPFEKSLTGLEIKDWIWHHTHMLTDYTSVAKGMNAFFNLDNDKIYMMALHDNIPVAKEVLEKGKFYEVPCDNNYRN